MKGNVTRVATLGSSCCGCGACAAKCVAKCITMSPDACGFMRPVIDTASCLGCAVCETVCPVLSAGSKDSIEFAIWAKSKNQSELLASSSGGMFALLAHEILSAGGVVCAAAWAPGCKSVQHVLVEDKDGLDAVMRSKYVQSHVSRSVYEGIRRALESNRRVLFVGTACQVAGMKLYLGKLSDVENFLAVDVICHGVPSPLLWQKWAAWREDCAGSVLWDVNMRSKTSGWLSYSVVYRYIAQKDGTVSEDGSVFMEDWYFKAFLENASLRSSCYACQVKRACGSDVTLGDFWGVQFAHHEVNHEGGVSALLCNTSKGVAAVDSIKGKIEWGRSSIEKVLSGNPSLTHSVAPYEKRDEFMGALNRGATIDELMKKWDFNQSLGLRLRRKLGRLKRKLAKGAC